MSEGVLARLLSFEVEADEAPMPVAAAVADASGGLIDLDEGRNLVGYAAHGTSIGDSLRALVEYVGVPLAERDGKFRGPLPTNNVQMEAKELGCDADGKARPKIERLRAPDSSLPSGQALVYYDPERDFQSGQMRASSGGGGAIEERTELPAALTASDAKQWVEQRLARRWLSANGLRLRLPPSRIGLRPGDRIRLPGSTRSLMLKSAEIDGLTIVVEAEAIESGIANLPADPGRPASNPDEPIGRSELALFELPTLGDAPEFAPRLLAAASNQGRWKPVPLELRIGQEQLAGQALSRRATLGRTTTMLDPRSPMILDELSSVQVRLVNSGQVLLNADVDAMMAGANLAMVGDELIQFGRAEQLEPGLFRLSRMLRGRRGTEWACPMHQAGEPFCLFHPTALSTIELPAHAAGALLNAVSHGAGDAAPLPECQRLVSGEAVRPLPVCHLRATRDGAFLHLNWVRRSHRGWAWNDSVGVPSDSFAERYRVSVAGPAGRLEYESDAPSANLSVASLPAEVGQTIDVEVGAIGPMALSRPRAIKLIL